MDKHCVQQLNSQCLCRFSQCALGQDLPNNPTCKPNTLLMEPFFRFTVEIPSKKKWVIDDKYLQHKAQDFVFLFWQVLLCCGISAEIVKDCTGNIYRNLEQRPERLTAKRRWPIMEPCSWHHSRDFTEGKSLCCWLLSLTDQLWRCILRNSQNHCLIREFEHC